jgi:uncharacterized protein
MEETAGPADQRPRPPASVAAGEAPPSARWDVPWGVLDGAGVLVVTAVVTAVLVFGIGTLAALEVVPDIVGPIFMPLPLIVLAVVTVAWVQMRFGFDAVRRLTGPARARLREWLLGLGVGVGAFLAVNIVLVLLLQLVAALGGFELPQPQEGAREAAADPELLPWLIVSAVVVAPLAEELFFRGMLYQALRRRMRAWWAIAVSAIAFAGAHVFQELGGPAGPVAFVLILPLGVLLGWLFERRGSLATPVAVHAAFNLVTVSLMQTGFA